jgi:hypothetical protein
MHYLPRKNKNSTYKWQIIVLVLIFSTVVSYVWQINHQAQYSFNIRELENKKQELEKEIKDITWEISSARSLASVTDRALELNLTQPEEISFLEVGLSTVAVVEDNLTVSP